MSKSKGNAVDPVEVLDKFGADAIRWYFYTNSAPWLPNRFYDEAVLEGQRKFMGTLWNTYAFFVLYANIDSFDPTQYALEYDKLSIMDRWLLSKLNSLIVAVDSNLEQYRITEAAKALDDFVDELSNWYVPVSYTHLDVYKRQVLVREPDTPRFEHVVSELSDGKIQPLESGRELAAKVDSQWVFFPFPKD